MAGQVTQIVYINLELIEVTCDRAYYKNSYMIQRNEEKARRSYLGQNSFNDDLPSRRHSKQCFMLNDDRVKPKSLTGQQTRNAQTDPKAFKCNSGEKC